MATRPTYDRDAVMEKVLEGIASARTLNAICAEPDMPHKVTVLRWLVDDERAAAYMQAKAVRAELYLEKIIEIVEDTSLEPADKRVRVDTYKWTMGKLNGKYSDKVKHVGGDDGDNPIAFKGWDIKFD